MPSQDLIERYAELVVGFGANVQQGQIVGITAEWGTEEGVRAIAASAYKRGAKFVDPSYFDPYVKRVRLLYAEEETLDFVPRWYGEKILAYGEERAARITLLSPIGNVFDGIDPVRAAKDMLPSIKEALEIINARTVNWCAAMWPTPEWAALVHPELEPEQALETLWEELVHMCRLDEADPIAAWDERMGTLTAAADRLNERRFDALHYEGPGTDLTVGLLPTSKWASARFSRVDGLRHHPNVPSEEIFTSPDPERVDGVVRSTKPLILADGAEVFDLEVKFEGGRAVAIDASEGGEILRGRCARDEGGSRLGEVALVDGEGRIGPFERVFYHTLLDENAASHLALGNAFDFAVDDEQDLARLNRSAIHIDFMVGSDDLTVSGITGDGERVPVLRAGAWQI